MTKHWVENIFSVAQRSFFGVVILCGALWSTPSSALGEQSEPGWTLVWADEFNGERLDSSKWRHEVDCWGGGNNERQCYTDSAENSFVAKGLLTIRAKKQRVTGFAMPEHARGQSKAGQEKVTKTFASARLTTQGKADWRYGRFVIRARLPNGQGTWPAIWMLPARNIYGPWAGSGEIDIMEAVNLGEPCPACEGGAENQVLGTLHYGGPWPKNLYSSKSTALPKSADGFHIFSVDWSEGKITWSIDGVRYSTQRAEQWRAGQAKEASSFAPFDQNFYLILNLAIGGHLPEGRNRGGISSADFPKTLEIDWVRIYKCEASQVGQSCEQ